MIGGIAEAHVPLVMGIMGGIVLLGCIVSIAYEVHKHEHREQEGRS